MAGIAEFAKRKCLRALSCIDHALRAPYVYACVTVLVFLICFQSYAVAQQPSSTVPLAPGQQSLEGTLTVIWGNPRPGATSGGATLFSLTLADGTEIPLQVPAEQASTAIGYFGKPVAITGKVAPDSFGRQSFAVETIAPKDRTPATTPQASITGTRRMLFLLLKFSDDSNVPHPPSFYNDLANPDTPPTGSSIPATINAFFKKTSWNQFSWTADVGGIGGVPASGWLTLPHPKSYYADCDSNGTCAQLNAIRDDGMALGAAQGIDFSKYDNINYVLSNDLDCCAWGGSISYNGKIYGATWEPPWGQETGTYSHELGHSIGLPHSGWVYYAYDSPWDVMSNAHVAAITANCGSYYSRNHLATRSLDCIEPGDGYIAAHKDYLGWIPDANKIVIAQASNVTATIEADALALGSATKMVKICFPGQACTGTSAHYLTLEARIRGSQFDNGLLGEGIIIHDFQADRGKIGAGDPCFFNTQSGWAVPIDATPNDWEAQPNCNSGGRSYPNYALLNAQWVPGQTYSNAAANVKVAVQQKSGSSYVVTISPLNSFTVAVSASPSDGGTVTGGGAYASGSSATVTASANTAKGYQFVNWTENGNQVSASPSFTFAVSGDRALVANFKGQSYVVLPLTQDIWTTSVYAYDSIGGGPGGGLADDTLRVGGWGDLYYSLLQFDLSNLPSSPTQVQLRLYDYSNNGGGPTGMNLYQITQYWNWKTQGTGRDRDRLWWSDQPSASLIASGLSAPTAGVYYYIDITELYKGWKSGTIPNYGIEFRPQSNNNNFNYFGSSRNANSNYRPALVITPSQTNYTISASASPSNGGTVGGGGTYAGGTSVTVTATANTAGGYKFVDWTEAGIEVSTSASYNFAANGDRSLVANFAAQPSCTLSANPSAINAGQSTILTWSSSNATSMSIDQGIGNVSPSGSMSRSPTQTTTYTGNAVGGGGSGTCATTVSVNATQPYTLTVSVAPNANGAVSSTDGKISNCTTSCKASYTPGASVSLIATPAGARSFAGWSGCSSHTNRCDLTVNSSQTVTANIIDKKIKWKRAISAQ